MKFIGNFQTAGVPTGVFCCVAIPAQPLTIRLLPPTSARVSWRWFWAHIVVFITGEWRTMTGERRFLWRLVVQQKERRSCQPLTKSTIVEVTEASVKKTSPLVTMKLALIEACVKTTFPLVTMKLTLWFRSATQEDQCQLHPFWRCWVLLRKKEPSGLAFIFGHSIVFKAAKDEGFSGWWESVSNSVSIHWLANCIRPWTKTVRKATILWHHQRRSHGGNVSMLLVLTMRLYFSF